MTPTYPASFAQDFAMLGHPLIVLMRNPDRVAYPLNEITNQAHVNPAQIAELVRSSLLDTLATGASINDWRNAASEAKLPHT